MKQKIAGVNPKDFNTKIRPQDDFYHFACGNWLRTNPIPKTEVRWGSFDILHDKNRKRIQGIFKELATKKRLKKGSRGQQLRDFYHSGMDEKYIEKQGLEPIAPLLRRIEKISNRDELIEMIAHLHTLGRRSFWSTFVTLDEKNSGKMALYVHQGWLGLPDKEYFLSKKDTFVTIRKKYTKHIRAMLEFSGVDKKEARHRAGVIVDIEIALARASMSSEERRDVLRMYNKMSVAKLQALAPNIDWKLYLKRIGAGGVRSIIVGQPKYLKTLSRMLKSVSLEDWKYYMRWSFISNSSEFLSKDIVEEDFKFYGIVINGLKKMKPRWQRVYAAIDSVLVESIGEEYLARYFTKRSEKILDELIENIKEVFKERINDLDWMSLSTKKLALKKLATFRSKIGGPKKPINYSKISIKKDTYVQNFFNAQQFEFKRDIKKLSTPIDREEWFMGAHVVNAYYWSNQNEIVFPAGILQDPFFDEKRDLALNYGAIGSVIGHELTHGFDDKGSLFDAKGNLHNWWTKKDRALFIKKTKILVNQYNNYTAIDEIKVNGNLTLGENLADLGGVILGYWALQKYMEHHGRLPDSGGFTPEQRFFFGLVIFERGNMSKESARFRAVCDPHAPAYTRVNGPFSNLKEFYNAFDVKKGDGMYRPPQKRAKIW